MIYTVTLNPALDYYMNVPGDLSLNVTNRSSGEKFEFGGKGINVSAVLAQLGIESVALGFIAGFTGGELERAVEKTGCKTDFIRLESGLTRVNVKIKGAGETEINAAGPYIPPEKLKILFEKLGRLCRDDILVLSGSVPPNLPQDIYARLLSCLPDGNIKTAADTTGAALLGILKFRPFVIKPNLAELEELCGGKCRSREEIIAAAKRLQALGAQNVLVSLGADGALLLTAAGETLSSPAVGGKAVNTVGAGDSMLAGFIAGSSQGLEYALRLGTAAGGATACMEGLATRYAIEMKFKELKMQ